METGLSPVRIGHPIEPILLAGGLPALPGSNLKPGKPVKSRPFHNHYSRFLSRITISANDRRQCVPWIRKALADGVRGYVPMTCRRRRPDTTDKRCCAYCLQPAMKHRRTLLRFILVVLIQPAYETCRKQPSTPFLGK